MKNVTPIQLLRATAYRCLGERIRTLSTPSTPRDWPLIASAFGVRRHLLDVIPQRRKGGGFTGKLPLLFYRNYCFTGKKQDNTRYCPFCRKVISCLPCRIRPLAVPEANHLDRALLPTRPLLLVLKHFLLRHCQGSRIRLCCAMGCHRRAAMLKPLLWSNDVHRANTAQW